jgi:hypothetical protein
MPVLVPLNELQRSTLEKAIKNRKIEVVVRGRQLQLTAANAQKIRDAVEELHLKKFKIKTKTVEHLEICYSAQEIIRIIDSAMPEFTNDNKIGVIEDELGDGSDYGVTGEDWHDSTGELLAESGTASEENNDTAETIDNDGNE